MRVKIKNKHHLKQKECRRLIERIHDQIDPEFTIDYSSIETGKIDEYEFIFIDGIPYFFQIKNQLFYTLKGLMTFNPTHHYVVVDMGAVKFVTNGADVMAPGIVDADPIIDKEDTVWICDEIHRKPLAVGVALITGPEMVKEKKGKAIILKHYIGDGIWKALSSF
jgi:PUA-domain protein